MKYLSALLAVCLCCGPMKAEAEECYPVDQYGKPCLSLRIVSERTQAVQAPSVTCSQFDQYGTCKLPLYSPTTVSVTTRSYEARNICAAPFKAYLKVAWWDRSIFESNISDAYLIGRVPGHGALRKQSNLFADEVIADCP